MPSLPKQTKVRGWCFTINNYTDEEFNHLQTIDCQYIVYGIERGESGTPHLQGYVHYKNAVRPSTVKATVGTRAHIEERRGTVAEAVDYCKKDGNFFERGKIRIGNENKWKDIIELAESCKLDVIKDDYPAVYLMHKAKLESLMDPKLTPFDDELKDHFEWWYGPTGTGKSRKVWEEYPIHFDKQLNKWWDGYAYQEVVVIEEADPKKCEHMAYFLKRWADRYPFRAEIKNGHLNNIRPKKIIVTSNYSIKECFPNPQDWEPLMRRFKQVHFDTLSPAAHAIVEESPLQQAMDPRYFGEDFQMDLENLFSS